MFFAFWQFFTWIISRIIGILFLHLKIEGAEHVKNIKKGGVLFVSNHHGKFDPFLIGAAIPRKHYRHIKCFRYLTYYKYIKERWYGALLWMSGAYPVYKIPGNLEKTLQPTVELLKSNQNVLIFPTSVRQKIFNANEARPGIAYIVRKINPLIVPVYISDTYNMSPKDIILRFRRVRVVFGRPFRYEITPGRETDSIEIAVDIMRKVEGLSFKHINI